MLEFRLEDDDAERGTALARAAAALGRTAIALSLSDSTVVAQVAQSAGFPALAGLLKEKMAALGGKGGGSPTFFRAAFASPDQAALFARYAKEALAGGRP